MNDVENSTSAEGYAVKKVVVIGQGYVGLPVAMRAVEVGFNVIGLDLDDRRIEALKKATSFVEDIADATVRAALSSGRYEPSNDYQDARDFDIAVITVPTPLRESLPDLSFIEASAKSLAPHISRGCTVVLESTTYPGTTQELLVPILEGASGLRAGHDFHVGYSPERIDPGNEKWNFVNTPKIVSGVTSDSLSRVNDFYSALVEKTVEASSPREAELAKLLENTFRHVNIALVNELAIFAHQLGVNVWEAIEAANTKPFGFMKFTPGPGVGGHCLPVDPSYLSWQVRKELGQSFRFVELANDVNEHMPDYVTRRLMHLLNERTKPLKGSKILLVGLAYKRNSGDIRESPALRLIELLSEYGAVLFAADPFVKDYQWPQNVQRAELTSEDLLDMDAAVLVTDHDAFDLGLLVSSDVATLDTRNRVVGPNITRL